MSLNQCMGKTYMIIWIKNLIKMIKVFEFLIYKLYQFAKAQEDTVNPTLGFLCFVSIFELLHLIILLSFLEDVFGQKLTWANEIMPFVGIIFVVIGISLNYFLFIRTKYVYMVSESYRNKNFKLWKTNLLFFAYILFLFMIILVQTAYHLKHH